MNLETKQSGIKGSMIYYKDKINNPKLKTMEIDSLKQRVDELKKTQQHLQYRNQQNNY